MDASHGKDQRSISMQHQITSQFNEILSRDYHSNLNSPKNKEIQEFLKKLSQEKEVRL